MYNFLRYTLLTLSMVGILAQRSAAQSQYAKKVVDSQFTDVTIDDLAADGNVGTAGKLKPTLAGTTTGASFLRVGFAALAPGGKQAGIIVQPDNSIQASLMNNITISTYKTLNATSAQLQESFPMSTLLGFNVGLSNATPTTISFQPGAGKEFDQIEIRVAGVNVSSDIRVFESFAGVITPLPVELTAFSGKATPTGVALKWETASERNADYFEVQRAESSSNLFHSLGQVRCFGNSTQAHSYQFADAAPAGLHYYRLRQVDVDGKESFSPVVTVAGGALATVLAAYPTLVAQTLTITGPAGMHLNVFNPQGQQVQVTDIAVSQMQQLDVRGLPGGTYFLRDAATGQSTRFIKTSDEW